LIKRKCGYGGNVLLFDWIRNESLADLIFQAIEDEMLFILLLSYAALVGLCESDGGFVMCMAITIEASIEKIS